MHWEKEGNGFFLKTSDGSLYEGIWSQGRLIEGLVISGNPKDHEQVRRGTVLGSTPANKGEIKYRDGAIYKGALRNLKPHGKGTLTSAEGDIKKGHWRRGDFNKCDSAETSVDKKPEKSQMDTLVTMIREWESELKKLKDDIFRE